jgi:hypothetical protein
MNFSSKYDVYLNIILELVQRAGDCLIEDEAGSSV